MSKVIIFSVVRDFEMYNRCVAQNRCCDGCELVPFDNRKSNASIPIAYNKMLLERAENEEAWYVFCHEDFQLKENFLSRMEYLDRNVLWGPIGATTRRRFGIYWQWQLLGMVEECGKDGSGLRQIGVPVEKGTKVDTFDCQCLIVHSTLINRLNLRFDENLTFDLYIEDFCIAAHEQGGIPSMILPLKARHWSGGSVQPRYYVQEKYLNNKYPSSCYTGTSSWTLGKRIPLFWRLTVLLKRILRKCFV
jgi:hypothetical protein